MLIQIIIAALLLSFPMFAHASGSPVVLYELAIWVLVNIGAVLWLLISRTKARFVSVIVIAVFGAVAWGVLIFVPYNDNALIVDAVIYSQIFFALFVALRSAKSK